MVVAKAAVAAKMRNRCLRFRKCGEFSCRRILLRMKGRVYQSCVRFAMLNGSETWCRTERKVVTMRSERAMVRAMSEVNLEYRRETMED